MRILFTIAGRAGSKGIKNKNIKPFLGHPLPYYSLSVIDLYLKKYQDHEIDIAINSDSEVLLGMMKNNPLGLEVETIRRDPKLGGDLVRKSAVIADCMYKMQERKRVKYDMIVDLDITSPLRTVEDLHNLIAVQQSKDADVTFSVTQARRNPYFNMVARIDRGYKKVIAFDITTRQQAPEIYDMNASLYAYHPRHLLSGRDVLNGYCECIFMYDTGILDLDHENDFELMEVIAKYLFETKPEFGEIYHNLEK